MKNFLRLLAFLLPLIAWRASAQVAAPAPPQSSPILITNATLHLGNGEVIENGAVGFDKGKITYVGSTEGAGSEFSAYEKVDATGKHVYPGLIVPNSTIGLEEISAVRASRDEQEAGDFNPNVRSIVAYNTDSKLLSTLRFTGIALAQPTPQGGMVSGSSSVVQLNAWNWEDAAYRMDDGLHLNWPRRMYGPRWWLGETNMRPNPDYEEQLAYMKQTMQEVKAYMEQKPSKTNLKFEAMKGLFDGSQNLYIHVEKAKDIVSACRFAKENGVQKIVVMGGRDAWLVTDFLKEHDIPVVLSALHRLPSRDDADVDLPFKIPAMLHEAGVKFCFGYDGGMLSTMRNLPFFAGTAAAYGLPKEEALKAITSTTAEVLGIADRTGTLKTGLDANIVVSEGDILDMKDNILSKLYIMGSDVPLTGMQQDLYEKYRQKYGHGK